MFKNLKLKTKLIIGFAAASLPILIIGYFSIYEIKQFIKPLEKEIPSQVQEIAQKSYLNNLAQLIRYYDEVLTQSARNYAFTGDQKWEQRYNENVPVLDNTIKEALKLGDEQDKNYFSNIDASNLALVDMETKALNLTKAGDLKQAIKILEGQEYWEQKNIYKEGLDQYAARRFSEKNKAVEASLAALTKINTDSKKSTDVANILLIIFSIVAFLASVIIGSWATFYIVNKGTAAEKKYKYLFDYSQDAIMTISPPDWKFTDGNSATLRMFGLKDNEELTTIAVGDLSPKYQPDGKPSGNKAKAMIDVAMTEGFNSFEWTHKKLNGPEFFANVFLTKVNMGRDAFLQAVVRDITEIKKSAGLIKKSEEEAKKALAESERVNKLMVGRELEMIKLKKEISRFKK